MRALTASVWRWIATALVLSGLVAAGSVRAGEPSAALLAIRGMIDPISARYVGRELDRAASDGATQLVVVQLDTPGGLDSSMRTMTQALLGSRVPVAVYVAPPGARAASAGMFITLAADVAAMAPGTEIGAAHPVQLRGRSDSVMIDKLVNDTAAFARSIAATRHRNGAWAESAVRESVSSSADEAKREGVIDIVARDVPDLLAQLDGRLVDTPHGPRTLHTAGLRVEERSMLFSERALLVLSNPNLAYLLFLLGLLGIAAELYHPGTFIPGTLGAVSLVLALVAFESLPISWAGVLLLVLAMGLFIGELHTPGIGALGAAAVVSFIVGSLLLYSPGGPSSPTDMPVRVSPAIIAVTTAAVASFFLLVIRASLRARRLAVRTGVAALVGQTGVATSELAPSGTVRVESEIWSAEAEGGPIHSGERVKVLGAAGVTLRVARAPGGEMS
jgi:membrane-bound serine protease (ClpP class)